MGLNPSRATCQGYDSQMLLIRKTELESHGPALTRETEPNEEASGSQSDKIGLKQPRKRPSIKY